jgi:opacity protein-like surface antigen
MRQSGWPAASPGLRRGLEAGPTSNNRESDMRQLWNATRLAAGRQNWQAWIDGPAFILGVALVGVIAAAAVSFFTPARADSLPGKGAVAAPAFTSTAARWTAPWVGLGLGYGVQATDISGILPDDLSLATHDIVGCGAAGYDHQFAGSNIVIGVGADVCFSRAESAVASWDRQWSVYARTGVLLTPTFLAYGLAGYTELGGGFEIPELGDRRGLTLGGGIEALFKDGWFIRAEGRWVSLGGDSGGGIDADSAQYAAMALIGYRFGAK